MTLKRITIYTKDIEVLTGRTDRYARKVMRAVRLRYNKQKHQLVSLGELCAYLSIPEEEAIEQLGLGEKRGAKLNI